jgi:hypothetical protein
MRSVEPVSSDELDRDPASGGNDLTPPRDPLRTLLALKQIAAVVRSVRRRAEQAPSADTLTDDESRCAAHDFEESSVGQPERSVGRAP